MRCEIDSVEEGCEEICVAMCPLLNGLLSHDAKVYCGTVCVVGVVQIYIHSDSKGLNVSCFCVNCLFRSLPSLPLPPVIDVPPRTGPQWEPSSLGGT